MIKEASISPCSKFRWSLTRSWDGNKPRVLFIMLNPSTADANRDDPTIRRLIGFTGRWGLGGFHVGNLFPYRETSPKKLFTWLNKQALKGYWDSSNPPEWMVENVTYLRRMADGCEKIVCAWGANGLDTTAINDEDRWPGLRYNEVVKLLRGRDNLYHLGLTVNDEPRHPLFLPYTASLTKI